MYIINGNMIKGSEEGDIRARMGIVKYLDDWADDVYYKAKETGSVSEAGGYIRERVLLKEDVLPDLIDAVVIADMSEFWRAVYGRLGVRDDVLLYTIFCTIFGELNDDMKKESKKLISTLGYIPELRKDFIEELTVNEQEQQGKLFGIFPRKAKKTKDVKNKKGKNKGIRKEAKVAQVNEYEEGIVKIEDKYVREDNVDRLLFIFSGVTVLLILVTIWLFIL